MQEPEARGAKGKRSKEEIQQRNKAVTNLLSATLSASITLRSVRVYCQRTCMVGAWCLISGLRLGVRCGGVLQAQQRFRDRQKV